MKCPNCGMNIRDDIPVCGYCGETIPQQPQNQSDSTGKRHPPMVSAEKKGASQAPLPPDEGVIGEEEDGGGLSPYLLLGEQVLIGSLNVSVKKFFFHAYMTDKRIFLIDTQEKKLKVTAKDVPRDTLAGSIVEFSENSDPVLVLSLRSADDEIKTMKIVFVQNGMDRSSEIDEWIALLHEKDEPLARASRPGAEEPEEPEPEQVPALPVAPVKIQELKPIKKPVRDLEKQPPVKRLISFAKAPEEVPPAVVQPVLPPRRAQVRQVMESVKQASGIADTEPKVFPVPRENVQPVKKPEVQSAMKVAMKSAMKPLAQSQVRPVKRTSFEHTMRRPVVEAELREPKKPPISPAIHDTIHAPPVREEPADVPQFCHNCGKKLPLEANFCPGCGTRLGQNRTLTNTWFSQTPREKRTLPTDTVIPERKPAPPIRTEAPDEDEIENEKPQPTKPPIKKVPRGSEMTILHKFLRR